jgi:deoxyribonuclease-4
LSIAKGYLKAGEEALELGANVFQFFTRNPRGGKAKELNLKDLAALIELTKKEGFGPLVAHAPYTLNPASLDPKVSQFARLALKEDLERLENFPGVLYNLHPGCHLGRGEKAGLDATMELLNEVSPGFKTMILLETMAGKGTELGQTFESLKYALTKFHDQKRIGVCFDVCHVHDAGYDLVDDLEGVIAEFDRVVGLDKLMALHLNDSKNPKGSRKDRHAKIGEGQIGQEALVKIISHPLLAGRPIILETPNEPVGYAKEIRLLKDALEVKP